MRAPVPFSRAEAAARGVTRHKLLTSSRYVQVTHGMWIDTEPETDIIAPIWADDDWARDQVRLTAGIGIDPRSVGCNVTAARLYGLPLPGSADKRLHVALGEMNASRRRRDAVLHRYVRLRADDFFGLPLISVPQLFAELAGVLTTEQLVELGDAAVGRWQCGPLTTIAEIRAELAARSRLVGRQTAQKAIELVREDVDSPPATRLRLQLIAAGFPEPSVHPAVYCGLIDSVLHPDMGYPAIRFAIEYEGDHHRTSPSQFAEDNRRIAALEAEGWFVLRVSKRSNWADIRRIVEYHLRRAGLL